MFYLLYFSPLVQFQLLHSKYHLCAPSTRGLLLSTYIKFVNLFPEIKQTIQDVSTRFDTLPLHCVNTKPSKRDYSLRH